MTRQVMVETSTCGGSDASLLYHQLDRRLMSEESLWTSVRFRMAAIPSAEEALLNLGMFDLVVLHLFYMGWRHSSAIADLLRIIEILGEIHTKVHGMISSHHLATTLLFGVPHQ